MLLENLKGDFCVVMAGHQGFEPWEVLPSPVFKTGAIDHSASDPYKVSYLFLWLEAAPGFEPGIKALQAHALPLGYAANCGARSRT